MTTTNTNQSVLSPKPPSSAQVSGLDTLRVLALALVTWQHAASVSNAYEYTLWRSISAGQVGVGIFCAISGFLAFQSTYGDAKTWLIKRLVTIFPSYWIVTLFAFLLALTFGSSKPITLGLVVSQILGIGFFTHGWNLVNVVSWFVSLILLCYLLTYLANKSGKATFFWIIIAIITSTLVATRAEVDLSRHVLAFSLAVLLRRQQLQALVIGYGLILTIIGILVDPQFFYAGFGIVLVHAAALTVNSDLSLFKWIAKYAYQYFLVHGIFLVAAAKLINTPLAAISAALFLSAVSSIMLYRIDQKLKYFMTPILQRTFMAKP